MRTLYYHTTSPLSRLVRVALLEKNLDVAITYEQPWQRRQEFLALNPAGEVPVMTEADNTVIVGYAILDYLEEAYPDFPLLPRDSLSARAEVWRLVSWFIDKFDREVTTLLVYEKLIKRLSQIGQPDATIIRCGLENIHAHLIYLTYLSENRRWLGGSSFSYADLAVGVQLSIIDFMDYVPWSDYPESKEWYARMKSRPSFRPLLDDTLPGIQPPTHYAKLDF